MLGYNRECVFRSHHLVNLPLRDPRSTYYVHNRAVLNTAKRYRADAEKPRKAVAQEFAAKLKKKAQKARAKSASLGSQTAIGEAESESSLLLLFAPIRS